ncbi:hypothetical protein ACLOJK_026771 [Asimina triloba]
MPTPGLACWLASGSYLGSVLGSTIGLADTVGASSIVLGQSRLLGFRAWLISLACIGLSVTQGNQHPVPNSHRLAPMASNQHHPTGQTPSNPGSKVDAEPINSGSNEQNPKRPNTDQTTGRDAGNSESTIPTSSSHPPLRPIHQKPTAADDTSSQHQASMQISDPAKPISKGSVRHGQRPVSISDSDAAGGNSRNLAQINTSVRSWRHQEIGQ